MDKSKYPELMISGFDHVDYFCSKISKNKNALQVILTGKFYNEFNGGESIEPK